MVIFTVSIAILISLGSVPCCSLHQQSLSNTPFRRNIDITVTIDIVRIYVSCQVTESTVEVLAASRFLVVLAGLSPVVLQLRINEIPLNHVLNFAFLE